MTDQNGCTATDAVTLVISPLPINTISGSSNVCIGSTHTYTTQAGMTNYNWMVSPAGTIVAGGTPNSTYVTVLWDDPYGGIPRITLIYTKGPCSGLAQLDVTIRPIINAGNDRSICLGQNTELGDFSSDPTISYTWRDQFGNIVSYLPMPVVSPDVTNTYTVIATSNGCIAEDQVTVTVNSIPTISGNTNNCDITTNYTSSNGVAYNWSIINGTINPPNNSSTINVTWNTPLDNLNPGIITVTSTENGCTASNSITVYNCCESEMDERMFRNEEINSSTPPFSQGEVIYINSTVTISTDINLNNNTFMMGPLAKIVVAPGIKLKIENASSIIAGCNIMWDGIYITDPSSELEVTGNSTIKDAINGIVSENGAIVTTNDANFIDNYYSIKINNTFQFGLSAIPPPGQPFTPYPGSIKNTRFSGSNSLPLNPHLGEKTLIGVYCNHAFNFTIGDESSVSLRNFFTDMRFGIYAYNSDINVYNNRFSDISNGGLPTIPIQKDYPEGAIYATHKPLFDERPDNYLNVGSSVEISKRNYFENCQTGIYSFQYVNSLNDNHFLDCYNGISLVNISSGTKMFDNLIYGSSGNVITPGKGISVRNAHPNNNGIDCLIEENHITNKRIGISVLGVKSSDLFTRVTKNHITNYVTDFPNTPEVSLSERQSGITISNCDGIEASFNIIYRNYPAIGAHFEFNTILGIWISDSKGANIFQNYMNQVGSGIYTNGSLTNTRFSCNTFADNYFGMQFDFNSDISDQGILNGYNPYNLWNDFDPQIGHERIYDNGLNLPGFNYCIDPNAYQAYDPSFNSTLSNSIQLVSNPNGEYLCENEGTVGPLGPVDQIDNLNAREVALGKIVRNEKYYSFLEDEYKLKDREYAYAILREDPSIMNMGGPDDNVYLQFYNDGYSSDIERVLQLREEMYEQNLVLAREKLEQIADDNTINSNRRIVDNIYIDTWANGIYDFSLEQENALLAVANLAAYAGGDAVYTARVLLNIDPMDIGVDYAIAPGILPQTTKVNLVKVFPNPASKQITIEFIDVIKNDAIITVYGNMGNLVLRETMQQNNYTKNIDVSQLNQGLYFYNITINGTKVSSGKLTILNK